MVESLQARASRVGFVAYRAVTCPVRMLPAFIVIGAHRGGTSSFYHYLTEHPDIGAATTKEVNFFDRNFHKGTLWYRAHFPSLAYQRYAEGRRHTSFITGEASPYYLFHPHVPRRIATTLPRVKLIALLRNPADRAWSQYQRYRHLGWETAPFADVIADEMARIGATLGAGKVVGETPDDVLGRRSALARGLYADQIQQWLRYFPREQLLMLRSEDFYADPAAALKQALVFLDMPPSALPETARYGRYDGYGRGGPFREARETKPPHDATMAPELRQRLCAFFAPHNQRLYALVGRDMEWE